jgi:hypothetical protein
MPVENEDDVIALCVDCGTTQRDATAARDPFLQEGSIGVCKYCGGPVVVTYASEVENIMTQRRQGKHI